MVMRWCKRIVLVVVMIQCVLSPWRAHAQQWNLPQPLTADNLSITFMIDTTWHAMEGYVRGLTGNIWLSDPKKFKTLKAHVTIPVVEILSNNDLRDDKMHDCMGAAEFPHVEVWLEKIVELCNPATLSQTSSCPFSGEGAILIKDQKRPLAIQGTVSKNVDGEFLVDAQTQLRWDEFGVRDPSIFIAKVDPKVTINFKVVLSKEFVSRSTVS